MLRRKTQFQHVPIILLSGMEAVGLMLLCASSCVMNHVLNVCSVLSQPCYYPSVGFLLLSSESSESSYVVLHVWIMCGVGCVVAMLCPSWMLHLLQPGCSGVIMFLGISAEIYQHAQSFGVWWQCLQITESYFLYFHSLEDNSALSSTLVYSLASRWCLNEFLQEIF